MSETEAPARIPTRERVLYATAELFRRRGYNGTGLKQVVTEAEAPFGSLYHKLPGGEQELAEEVIGMAGGSSRRSSSPSTMRSRRLRPRSGPSSPAPRYARGDRL